LGTQQQFGVAWRAYNTADLPEATSGRSANGTSDARFDAGLVRDQGQRLLHFLRQRCHTQGGTYWLYREQNSPAAELFDLSCSSAAASAAGDSDEWKASASNNAFRTTPSLAPPIAALCFHLAKSLPSSADQRQLLQKGLQLLEPTKEEHAVLYSMTAMQLGCSYMRTPQVSIPDAEPQRPSPQQGPAVPQVAADPPPAARLAVALRYFEGILKLINLLDGNSGGDRLDLAELRLQANVAYAECIVKLVREACIPTYSAWLAEVQRSSHGLVCGPQAALRQMKRQSAAFLLWRLFWLCRAQRAFAFLPPEKREAECWTLDRDLCEITGDALYGLSRYPADDADELLGGPMKTADGICGVVEDGLRTWGLRGPDAATPGKAVDPNRQQQPPVPRKRRQRASID